MKIFKDGDFIGFKNDEGYEIYDIRISNCNGYASIRDCLSTKKWATKEIINEAEQTAFKDMARFDD